MAASRHLVIWPKVRITIKGTPVIVAKGELVPAGVSDVDLSNLVSFGAIAGVIGAPSAEAEPKAESENPDTVKAILKAVGDDKDKATAALEQEMAKGDAARPSLVEHLKARATS